ncbi:MAG: GIY-YIG nuclease family protein [Gammaproteobacteria bacterium]|nr:MAG: GIY-YIG nuclease family protein [Gammaproteobacteria bacterium]
MIRTMDGQLYTGITTDMQRRWHEHSSGKGGARYFRGRKPQSLCLLEEHSDRSSASRREAQIKKYAKPVKESLVAQSHGSLSLELFNNVTPA